MKPVQRTFKNTWGKWVEQPRRAAIVVCACGKKYISTREGQNACLPCMHAAKLAAKKLA